MITLRERFTKWYYRKGYTLDTKIYGNTYEMIFVCPWWVRLFVGLFFSPSVYYREVGYKFGSDFVDGFASHFNSDDDDILDDCEAPGFEDEEFKVEDETGTDVDDE